MVFGFRSSVGRPASPTSTPHPIPLSDHVQSLLSCPYTTRSVDGPNSNPNDERTFETVAPLEPELILRTVFNVRGGFPNTKLPTFTVLTKNFNSSKSDPVNITHPLLLPGTNSVNPACVLPLKNLSEWLRVGCTAGEVVAGIIGEFLEESPKVVRGGGEDPPRYEQVQRGGSLGESAGGSTSRASSLSSSSARAAHAGKPRRGSNSGFHIPIPPVPSTFPSLGSLTDAQLTRLLDDDVAFKAHLSSLESVKSMAELKRTLKDGNVKSAAENLSREADLNGLYFEVIGMQGELRGKVEAFEREREKVLGPPKQPGEGEGKEDEIIAIVDRARAEEDERAEDLASEFVEGDVPVAEFVKKFKEMKTLVHQRGGKIERVRQEMNNWSVR